VIHLAVVERSSILLKGQREKKWSAGVGKKEGWPGRRNQGREAFRPFLKAKGRLPRCRRGFRESLQKGRKPRIVPASHAEVAHFSGEGEDGTGEKKRRIFSRNSPQTVGGELSAQRRQHERRGGGGSFLSLEGRTEPSLGRVGGERGGKNSPLIIFFW